MNIMDGMDAARYESGNPDPKANRKKDKEQEKTKDMPMVLRNLNNK